MCPMASRISCHLSAKWIQVVQCQVVLWVLQCLGDMARSSIHLGRIILINLHIPREVDGMK
jgi:hypothetical protein